MDERPHIACCQFADDDTLTTDAAVFDCDQCPVRWQLEDLAAENVEAWVMFTRLSSRFLIDAHLIGDAFRHLTAGRDAEDILDILERLEVIYDILQPPPAPK